MIYPNALKQGDTVMIIAPSGAYNRKCIKGVNVLQEMGLSVIIGKSVYEKYGFLAGSDQVRLDDIHEAFTNNEVKAIFVHEVVMEVLVFFLTFNMKLLGRIQNLLGI